MESCWVRQVGRVHEVLNHVVNDFPWSAARKDTKAQEQELAQLANAVLEYGKMKYQFSPNKITVIEVTEVAFRFRETRRAITGVLKLLEKHGLAEPTDLPGLWKLYVADLDQQAHGDDVVRLIRGHPQ